MKKLSRHRRFSRRRRRTCNREGEARLADLISESEVPREEVSPAVPTNFGHELAELRVCVEELRRLSCSPHGEVERKKTLAGLDFVEFHTRRGSSELERVRVSSL